MRESDRKAVIAAVAAIDDESGEQLASLAELLLARAPAIVLTCSTAAVARAIERAWSNPDVTEIILKTPLTGRGRAPVTGVEHRGKFYESNQLRVAEDPPRSRTRTWFPPAEPR